MLTIKIKIYNL